jgi:hypothetical protein
MISKAKLQAARDKARAPVKAPPISEEEQSVLGMCFAYEDTLKKYNHAITVGYTRFYTGVKDKPRLRSIMLNSANIAKKNNVSFEEFVKAQFYWIHKWFNRAAKIYELNGVSGKFPAEWRLQEYIKLNSEGKLNNQSTSSPVVFRESDIDPKLIDKINKERLTQLRELYNLSEEECFFQFVPAGMFDLGWLKRQAIYKTLKTKGLV